MHQILQTQQQTLIYSTYPNIVPYPKIIKLLQLAQESKVNGQAQVLKVAKVVLHMLWCQIPPISIYTHLSLTARFKILVKGAFKQ